MVQDALADMPAMGNTPGAPRGTPGGVPTPAAITPAPDTACAGAEPTRTISVGALRSLEPTVAAQAHTPLPEAGLATPATKLRQASDPVAGQTAGPLLGSCSQSCARDSHAPAHTPPNLGVHGHIVHGNATRPDDRPAAAEMPPAVWSQGPLEAAPGSLVWGSVTRTSQDSSPHIDATFRAGVGSAHAEAVAAPLECVGVAGHEAAVGCGGARVEYVADAVGEQADVAPEALHVAHGAGGAPVETSRFASHLERLAAAIRQDEEIRNAQKATIEAASVLPSGEGDVKNVNMRAQVEEDGEPQDASEGEFAADDDEEDCLATPPDARPETVFM